MIDDLFDVFGEVLFSFGAVFWLIAGIVATVVFFCVYYFGNVEWALVATIVSAVVALISGAILIFSNRD